MSDKARIVAWLRNRAEDKRRMATHAEGNRDGWFATMPPDVSADWIGAAEMLEAAADLIERKP